MVARLNFIFFAAALAVSAYAEDTVLLRVDGGTRLVLHEDSSYTYTYLGENASVHNGVFEPATCWNTASDSIKGNYFFYTADGGACCIDMRNLGTKVLLKQLAGYQYKVCNGGVFSRVKN